MQRPERVAYIGLGAAFSGYLMILAYPYHSPGQEISPWLLIVALSVVAFTSNRVAIERFWVTYKALKSREGS
jgi:hypothetical protein